MIPAAAEEVEDDFFGDESIISRVTNRQLTGVKDGEIEGDHHHQRRKEETLSETRLRAEARASQVNLREIDAIAQDSEKEKEK